jgi:hypothetical protein
MAVGAASTGYIAKPEPGKLDQKRSRVESFHYTHDQKSEYVR